MKLSKVELGIETEGVQVSKADNRQFRIQIGITILATVLTPLLTMLGVQYQQAQEQKNWNVQRKVIMFEKLQEQKIQSFQRLNVLLAEYRRSYKNNMNAQYFGSFAPNISLKDLELADALPEQKEELELRAVEFSKGELWKYSVERMTESADNYNEAFDNLSAHIQSSIFFFSPNSRENMKEFSDYINYSFRSTWPKPNHDALLQLVVGGKHPWEAIDIVIENDFKTFSEFKLNELQTKMIQQMVQDIYFDQGFDAKNGKVKAGIR